MAHVCTQCSTTFADKDQLKEHLESHADRSEQAPTLALLKKDANRNAAEDRKRQSSHSSSDGKDNDDSYRTRGKRRKVKEATQQRKNLKTPETYTPGSQEELWSVEIAETGQVSCPICHAAIRKTVEGIKKHRQECTECTSNKEMLCHHQEGLKCEHCSKEFKSLAAIKYHLLAEHNQWGCTASFLSLTGYQYHAKRCGKNTAELAAMNYKCVHCSREHHSKVGHDYHIKAKHSPAANKGGMGGENDMRGSDDGNEDSGDGMRAEGNRLPRKSAMRAVRQMHELVLRYTKPDLPYFLPKILEKWRRDVKKKGEVICPNQGEHITDQYQCLICQKELGSESGVKYHITNTHNVNWFLESSSSSGGNLGTKSKKKGEPEQQHKVMPDASATATRTGLPKQGRGRRKGGSLSKRGRGRPRRSVDPAAEEHIDGGTKGEAVKSKKGGRGRPRSTTAATSNKTGGTAGKFGMEGGPREDGVVEEEATLGEGVAMMDEAAMVMLGGSGDEIVVSTGFERGIGDRKVRDKNENIGTAIVQLTRVDDEEMEEVHLEVDGITGIEWHNP
ncbi:unnamed protein product [Lampetra planeri]